MAARKRRLRPLHRDDIDIFPGTSTTKRDVAPTTDQRHPADRPGPGWGGSQRFRAGNQLAAAGKMEGAGQNVNVERSFIRRR